MGEETIFKPLTEAEKNKIARYRAFTDYVRCRMYEAQMELDQYRHPEEYIR